MNKVLLLQLRLYLNSMQKSFRKLTLFIDIKNRLQSLFLTVRRNGE